MNATQTHLSLFLDGSAIRVKETNGIYCVAQSEQVAKDILQRHHAHAAMQRALKWAVLQVEKLAEDGVDIIDRAQWLRDAKEALGEGD